MRSTVSRETALVLDCAELASGAKRLRYLERVQYATASPELLERCARHLRAASYSLLTAARRFEQLAAIIRDPEEEGS